MAKLCQNHNFNVRPTQMGGTFPKFYNFHFVNFLCSFMYKSQNFQIPTPTKSIIYLKKTCLDIECFDLIFDLHIIFIRLCTCILVTLGLQGAELNRAKLNPYFILIKVT